MGGVQDSAPIAGFRVYDTFNGSHHSQIVAVWSTETAKLEGIVIGEKLGAIRTGAIGGVAIRHLSDADAATAGVVGSGLQARMQLVAAAAVRRLSHVRVYSRSEANRKAFAEEMQRYLGLDIEAVDSAAEAVRGADIVICATSSSVPVLRAKDLKPGAHINTVGPKTIEGHEIDLDVAKMAHRIATDSPNRCEPTLLHSFCREQATKNGSKIWRQSLLKTRRGTEAPMQPLFLLDRSRRNRSGGRRGDIEATWIALSSASIPAPCRTTRCRVSRGCRDA